MKEIPLTQGKIAIVDDDWFDSLTTHYTWCASLVGTRWYAVTSTFGKEYMHQIVMENKPHLKGMEIDHVNRNTLDNREENLRWVTRSQNVINTSLRKDNHSGIKGVYYRPKSSKIKPWVAEIHRKGKRVWMKSFSTCEEAKQEREVKAQQLDNPTQTLNPLLEAAKFRTLSPASQPPPIP